jgi:hypothetical protein
LDAKWRENPDRIRDIGEEIAREMKHRQLAAQPGELGGGILDEAFAQFERMFDDKYGGFGEAPKFPAAHNLSFLLRYHVLSGNKRALDMAEKTLDAMYRGGMYDHIGKGFARYSTDRKWLVPHFEKMLYDNALLAMAYTEAHQLTGSGKYKHIACDILEYVLRDMTDAEGGFYSAEDADSEGEEGKFYVWTPDEVAAVLGEEEAELICGLYGITREGNFEGRSIPNLIGADLDAFALSRGLPPEKLGARIEASRQKLFEHRERRVHPHKDDKILTAWNGLMIAALAKAAAAFQNEAYAEAAARAERFLWTRLRREDGRLLARYRDGEAAYPGYLDDYAFYVWGLIELYEAVFDIGYLRKALELNEQMIRLFRDEAGGGLFFTGADAEELLARPKETYDGAMPSGNSAAAMNFIRLARLTGDAGLERLAEEQFRAAGGGASRYPMGHAALLSAWAFASARTREIVIAGNPDREETRRMVRAVQTRFLPFAVIVAKRDVDPETERTIPYTAGQRMRDGQPAAYVCENFACREPVTDAEALSRLLSPAAQA